MQPSLVSCMKCFQRLGLISKANNFGFANKQAISPQWGVCQSLCGVYTIVYASHMWCLRARLLLPLWITDSQASRWKQKQFNGGTGLVREEANISSSWNSQRRDMAPQGNGRQTVLRWRRDISSGKPGLRELVHSSAPLSLLPLTTLLPYEWQWAGWVGSTVNDATLWFGETLCNSGPEVHVRRRSPWEKPCDVGNCEYCLKKPPERLPSHQVISNCQLHTALHLLSRLHFIISMLCNFSHCLLDGTANFPHLC